MITKEVLAEARKLWDYHHLYHVPAPSDCILVLGSHDLRVADRGAELYLQGLAPILIFSGGLGNVTKGIWKDPEADKFARIALDKGVPAEAIFIENQSTNAGDNILFTQLVSSKTRGCIPGPFCWFKNHIWKGGGYATFKKHWPDKELIVTSPQIAFEDYPTPEIPMERVIQIMLRDLQRIRINPENGIQIEQEIPEEVWEAYGRLVEWGFTQHLVS